MTGGRIWKSSSKRIHEEPTYYYFDHDTGAEEEKDLESSYAGVQDLIGELS